MNLNYPVLLVMRGVFTSVPRLALSSAVGTYIQEHLARGPHSLYSSFASMASCPKPATNISLQPLVLLNYKVQQSKSERSLIFPAPTASGKMTSISYTIEDWKSLWFGCNTSEILTAALSLLSLITILPPVFLPISNPICTSFLQNI